MKTMFRIMLTSVLCSTSQVGCKLIEVLQHPTRTSLNVDPPSHVTPVASFSLQDPACQSSEGIADIGHQTVTRLKQGETKTESVDFSGVAADGTNGLHSKFVGFTIFGLRQLEIKQCTKLPSGELDCTSDGEEIISGGSPLRLCNKDFEYSRNSVEGVALATTATIEQAGQFYKDNVPSGRTLDPIWSLVLPSIDVQYRGKSSQGSDISVSERKSDNAFWSTGHGKRSDGTSEEIKIITVLPPSMDFQTSNKLGAKGLWELPFVVAHEFGHHVFFSNVLSLRSLFSLGNAVITQKQDGFEISNTNGVVADQSANTAKNILARKLGADFIPNAFKMAASPTHEIGTSEAFVAINEAFADLFAQYTVGGIESMQAIPGICENRDLTKNSFKYGGKEVRKSLDTPELKSFLNPSENSERSVDSSGCFGVSFQDPHVVGAIVASGFHSLLSDLNSNGARVRVLVQWAQSLDLEMSLAGSNPQALLINSLWAIAEKAAAANNGTLNARQCSAFKTSFPIAVSEDPRKLASFGCLN
jgi:hypothetical protein